MHWLTCDISIFLLVSIDHQVGFSLTWSETQKTCYLASKPNVSDQNIWVCRLIIKRFDRLRHEHISHDWASTRENLSSGVCEQQRRRPVCAFEQTDQRLCYSLIGKYHIKTCYERNFDFLASLCSWAGWFEFHFIGNPEDRFCHVEAHHCNTMYCTFVFLDNRQVPDIVLKRHAHKQHY